MLCFKTDEGLFNFRTAGILIHDSKVLIHRELKDDFYAFPGGRAEMFESTEKAVVREFKEEISASIKVNRLLWVIENFYVNKEIKRHELCFYFLIELTDTESIPLEGSFLSTELDDSGKPHLEFKWVDINSLSGINLYPESIKKSLTTLPTVIEHLIEYN